MDRVDRLFWGILGFVGVHFVWLAWLEARWPLWIGTALAAAGFVWFVARGHRLFGGAKRRE